MEDSRDHKAYYPIQKQFFPSIHDKSVLKIERINKNEWGTFEHFNVQNQNKLIKALLFK